MQCPKCSGEAWLAEEELVQVLNSEPQKVVVKAIYQCKSCSEKFSRIVYDILDSRVRAVEEKTAASADTAVAEPVEGLKFF